MCGSMLSNEYAGRVHTCRKGSHMQEGVHVCRKGSHMQEGVHACSNDTSEWNFFFKGNRD